LTCARDRPHDAGVKQVTIRIELRISEEMNEYLATEANARKLSFEGLLLSWIEERMNAQREQARRRLPG
jgi:predicted HicB family RNase H-like nuclease